MPYKKDALEETSILWTKFLTITRIKPNELTLLHLMGTLKISRLYSTKTKKCLICNTHLGSHYDKSNIGNDLPFHLY